MKKMCVELLSLYAILFNFNLYAQQKQPVDNKSLLWKISGKHLAQPSYLFGTMHMLCPDDYVWTKKMKESLGKTRKICFEMNMNDPKVLTAAMDGFLDKSGKKLSDYFTPEQYKIVKSYFKDSLHMDLASFQQMKPVALQSMMAMGDVHCANPVSYEDSIMKTSLKEKKEIAGLEEAEEQIDVLNSMPLDSVISDIIDQIQNKSKNDSEYRQLTNAYRNQDLPALYSLITASKELGDDMGIFLDERNKKWISRMQKMIKDQPVFFAVGAGHLWGDNGVINLLKKAGYEVDPLK
jgi:uncharacterized protein YbaP (TraB family)